MYPYIYIHHYHPWYSHFAAPIIIPPPPVPPAAVTYRYLLVPYSARNNYTP
ncbi:hypothetical protein J7E81_12490 [Bacillus sp. ISL-18]|uniref:hypothetical protein n=1 Tax=Bacillus sp. ISL-18 TaxID=2819118 RepID=UPI001BE69F97|nr:hypothetical protein [Bacillus sp. ISL-18]MBT2656039.1 hypothetical protein [Bacillus sp. ISL-18]